MHYWWVAALVLGVPFAVAGWLALWMKALGLVGIQFLTEPVIRP